MLKMVEQGKWAEKAPNRAKDATKDSKDTKDSNLEHGLHLSWFYDTIWESLSLGYTIPAPFDNMVSRNWIVNSRGPYLHFHEAAKR